MSSLDEIRQERIRKRDMLAAAGMNPYAATTSRTHAVTQVLQGFETLSDDETEVVVAGRVMALRRHGGSAFADIYDGTARMQLFFSRDTIGLRLFDLLNDAIDPGDFIEVKGVPFVTKRGAEAIAVSDWQVLTKAIRNIPTEHFGIKDEDERYRQRHLDILLNPEQQELFKLKSKFWDVTREFMKEQGFLEVETPSIEVTTGGAEARPFKTYHNDYDIDVFMRISVGELWQKRLMAAGFPKTFEIGRVYRNEGTSPEHLQEFTNMEFYWAYADYRDGMQLIRDMYIRIAQEVFGTTKFETRGFVFDLADAWREIDYVEEIKQQTNIDVTTATEVEMAARAEQLGITYDGQNRERLTDTLWKYCRKQIAGPAFLMNHPLIVGPLAKQVEGQPVVQMFQPIIAGSEVGRGYSELNDPLEQAERFAAQQKLLEAGDEEAMMPDWEFVEMLEDGMPPTCGFGFGERLFAFLADKPLRETQLFPLMKPKTAAKASKKTETKVAVAVLNTDADMVAWQKSNTVAHLCAELGARGGTDLLKFNTVRTADNTEIPMNIQHAILVKDADSNQALQTLFTEATNRQLHTAVFTREMLETTNDNTIKEQTAEKTVSEIEYLGVLVFGPRSEVEQLTEQFSLSE